MKSKMVNNCKFINLVLTLCELSKASCRYMADPHSCPSYDEIGERSYQSTPDWAPQVEETETVIQYAERLDAELNGMGIKVTRESEAVEDKPEAIISEKPGMPCSYCGLNNWWKRDDGGWVCSKCHPKPTAEAPDWF